MAGERTGKKSVFAATEVSPETDPSADGSGYTNIPAWEVGEVEDLKLQEPTSQQDGTIHGQTPPEEGADGWRFTMKVPLIGNATAAGDGVAPPAADWLDLIYAHIWDAAIVENGEGLAAASTTSSIVLDAILGGLQSLMPIHEALVPTGGERTQWTMITSIATAPTYPVAPTITQAPTTAAIRYGARTYLPSDAGGATLAFHHKAGEVHKTLLMGRCTSAKIPRTPAKKSLVLDLTFEGTRQIPETKAALPAITRNTVPALKLLRSPVWFNNMPIVTSSIEVDFGINAAQNESTAANEGAADFESISVGPRVMLEPMHTQAIEDLKRNLTLGPMLLQLGAGILSGGRLNTQAIHFALAHAEFSSPKDDRGYRRAPLTIVADRMGMFSGSTPARLVQVVRA